MKSGDATPAPMAAKLPKNISNLSYLSAYLNKESI